MYLFTTLYFIIKSVIHFLNKILDFISMKIFYF